MLSVSLQSLWWKTKTSWKSNIWHIQTNYLCVVNLFYSPVPTHHCCTKPKNKAGSSQVATHIIRFCSKHKLDLIKCVKMCFCAHTPVCVCVCVPSRALARVCVGGRDNGWSSWHFAVARTVFCVGSRQPFQTCMAVRETLQTKQM